MREYLVRRTIDQNQVVTANSEEEAAEIAAANPNDWETGGEEYDIETHQSTGGNTMSQTSELVPLEREGDGVYRAGDWRVQNPHLMNPSDSDKNWYGTTECADLIIGPFDTLKEVQEYITRFTNVDEWLGRVTQALRDLGREDLASEIAGISDHEAMTYRDTNEDPAAAAQIIINAAPPAPPTRKYEVTIADRYTIYRTLEVQAANEQEAMRKAERQYEDTYDAEEAFTLLAHKDAAGEHEAIEAHEIQPETTSS